ncbi:MAG: nuclear transport factor 2 family protein [Microscillaceae bacterium]|jgi:ketosteroid isomerase-like protein|nr:nuclear transport factor 2 family protein [Microscillaceae bacterium]
MNNVETAKAIYSALHEGKLDELTHYLTDDCLSKTPELEDARAQDRVYMGKDQLDVFFRQIVQAPNIREFVPCTFIENGDNVLIINKVMLELQNSEVPLENDVMHIATFEDGKLKQIKSMAWN